MIDIESGIIVANKYAGPIASGNLCGGNTKAAKTLVGRVMKLSKGQVNPKVVTGILLGKLQG